MPETQVRPMGADYARELGIVLPETTGPKTTILTHLFDYRLTDDLRMRRIEEFKAAQEEWIGQKVCRRAVPHIHGTVVYVLPANTRMNYNRHVLPTTILSAYDAFIKWPGGKHTILPIGVIQKVKKRGRKKNADGQAPG